MGDVSARPANLNTFAGDQSTRAGAVQAAAESLDDAFRDFVCSPGGGCAADGIATVNTDVPAVVADFRSLGEYVKLLHEAILRADKCVVNGVATIDHGALLQEFNRVAAEHGTTVDQLSEVTVRPTASLPEVGTIPPDSGYVDDPVCTSTGYLVAASMDFVMPARLLMLAGERTYASGSDHAGAFGRGWCSWFDVRLERLASGLVLVSNDAQRVDLRDAERCATVGLTAEEHDSGVTIRWAPSSRRGLQVWEFDGDGRLVTVSAELLGVTEFVRDGSGRLIELCHDSGRSVTYRWEAERVVEAVSSDGRRAECRYDDRGDIVELVNAIDPLRFDLDDHGRIVRIVDADDVVRVEMEYDDESRVICQRNAMGTATRFSYVAPYRTTVRDGDGEALSVYVHDDSGHVKMAATVDGFHLTQRFDERGRVTAQSYPDGRNFVVTSSETESGRIEERIWSTGLLETFEFDQQDRLARHSTSIAADQTTSTVPTYDGDSTLPSHLGLPDGSTFDIEWQYGVPVRITDADGVTVTSIVDPDGTPTAVVDGLGNQQTFEYHASGTISASTYPDGHTIVVQRDDAGRPTRLGSADSAEVTFAYTAAGRLQSITDPSGAVHQVEYRESGLVEALIDPLGHRTEFGFDELERLVRVDLADGSTVGYDLDVCGRIVGVAVDESVWRTTRDDAGRQTAVIDPVGRTTRYTYSADGLAASMTDPTGATWWYAFDAAMRLIGVETADGNEVVFEPTPTGKIARSINEAGVEHVTSYTPAGRVASRSTGPALTSYMYDAAGRLTTIDTGSGSWRFERDVRGRIVSATTPEGRQRRVEYDRCGRVVATTLGDSRWSFKYDAIGRLVESNDPVGRQVQMQYDLLGKVVAVTDPVGAITRYEYDERSRAVAMIDALGASWDFQYDAFDQVVGVATPHADDLVVDRDLSGRVVATRYGETDPSIRELDAAGREMLITGTADSVSLNRAAGGNAFETVVDGHRTSLGWAAHGGLCEIGDLTDVERPVIESDRDGLIIAVSTPTRRVELERDLGGHVIRRTDLSIDPVDASQTVTAEVNVERDVAGRIIERRDDKGVHRFAYDEGGRVISASTIAVTAASVSTSERSWEYDLLGRLIREHGPEGATHYEYGEGHQLISMTTPSGSTRFEYDNRGRRVASFGEFTTRFEWGELGLRHAVVDGVEVDSVPGVGGLPTSVAGVDFVWEIPDTVGIAYAPGLDPIDVVVSSQCGALGSTTWGDYGSGSSTPTWHPFHGIAAAGLVWLGQRVYDPVTRQFLSPDPAAVLVGAPSGTWTYNYAAADPVNLIDPWGTYPISIDDFNRIMDDATSVQWGNVGKVAIIVAAAASGPLAVAMLPATAGLLTTVATGAAVGAFAGGASDFGIQLIDNGGDFSQLNLGSIAKSTVFGGVLGGAGTGFGSLKSVSSFKAAGMGHSALAEGGVSFASSVLVEGYDAIAVGGHRLPGSDQDFNIANVVFSTAGGAAGGAGGYQLQNRGGGPKLPSQQGVDNLPEVGPMPPSSAPITPEPVPPVSPGAGQQATNAGPVKPSGVQLEPGQVVVPNNGIKPGIYHGEQSPHLGQINMDTAKQYPNAQAAADAGHRPTNYESRRNPDLPQPQGTSESVGAGQASGDSSD